MLISDTVFKEIPNSDYSFGYISLSAGSHHISADTTFGIMVYGYGNADSYGYCGGQDTKRLLELIMDKTPPQISQISTCDSVHLIIREDSLYDSGIDYIGIIQSPNVNVTLPTFNRGAVLAKIHGVLIDQNQDGTVYFVTNDRKGLSTSNSISIKGFTLQSISSNVVPPKILHSLSRHNVTITNFGLFPQSVTPSLQSNTTISIPPSFGSFVVNPNDSITIPLWVEATSLPSVTDTLILTDDCYRQLRFPLEIQIIPDTSLFNSRCEIPVQVKNNRATLSIQNRTISVNSATSWEITIYSVVGIRIQSFSGVNNNQISLDSLPSGFYIMECNADGNLYHYSVSF